MLTFALAFPSHTRTHEQKGLLRETFRCRAQIVKLAEGLQEAYKRTKNHFSPAGERKEVQVENVL